MPIVVLVLIAVAYGYAMIVYPEFRRWGAAAGLIVAGLLGLYFTRQAPETALSASRIDPAEVTLQDLTLDSTPRGASLAGRIKNGSSQYRLRDLTLRLRLHDCPAPDKPPADCPVIGEAEAIARPDVPPGQIRALTAHFIFSDLPPVVGTLRWDWTIVDLRATD